MMSFHEIRHMIETLRWGVREYARLDEATQADLWLDGDFYDGASYASWHDNAVQNVVDALVKAGADEARIDRVMRRIL